MNCLLCQSPLPKDAFRCPSCRNLVPSARGEKEEAETVILSEARVSSVKRLDLGFLNRVFGGGLVRTSANLVGGLPGAGKTTLFLQVADMLLEQLPGELLYVANEQSDSEILVTAERIRVQRADRIRVVRAMGGLRRPLDDLYRQYRPCAVILDSLTKLVGEDLEMAVTVAERMKLLTVEYGCPSLIVNQVNKEGDHAGLQKLQHAVDGTFLLELDQVDGARYLVSMKNRHGAAPVGVELAMTPEDAEVPGRLVLAKEKEP